MDEKEAVLQQIQKTVGYVPTGSRELLSILIRPDLIKLTRAYLDRFDKASECKKYPSPWSCVREAEAHYQNIKFGWMGGAGGIGFDDSWCVTCRAKVMGDEVGGPILSDDELRKTLSKDELRILGLIDRDGC